MDLTRRRKDAKKDRPRKRLAPRRICEPKGVGDWEVRDPSILWLSLASLRLGVNPSDSVGSGGMLGVSDIGFVGYELALA